MKASELLEEIKENLKDYPIEYLKNKVTDDRYKDPLTKQLAKYNSETWDEIFALNISEDYEIKDGVVENNVNVRIKSVIKITRIAAAATVRSFFDIWSHMASYEGCSRYMNIVPPIPNLMLGSSAILPSKFRFSF